MTTIWILRIITAIIILQTLRYKFTGHKESKELFKKVSLLGLPEQYGRIGTGIIELALGILVLIPQTSLYAALATAILMATAISFHISKIGFKGNNLPLALSAIVALVTSIVLILLQ